jgi:signal transduction histidine kinase
MPVAVNETFVLNNLVESVYSLFSEEENIHFDIKICMEELKIYADQSHIMRVLNNLIKNAIQAIPDDKIGQIVISLDRKDNFALIRISDNGIGVAEDKKENMFSPNFTTKSAGMGLGLSMSKTIISSVNGKIYFESEEGKGTDFYVEIPLSI